VGDMAAFPIEGWVQISILGAVLLDFVGTVFEIYAD
jgi:hypothetical protein